MKIKVLSAQELLHWVNAHIPPSIMRGILFVGDRISCLDEAIGLKAGGEIVGVATIAPEGEMMSGRPTIVALYVLPEFRQRGYGKILLEAAVERCLERGFEKIRVDVMSSYAMRAINSLPTHLRDALDVRDQGDVMNLFPE